MATTLRQLYCLLFGALVSNRVSTTLLGALNRRSGLIQSVFVAYPADEEYAQAYIPPGVREGMRWKPWPVGFFRQGKAWGIMYVISSVEKELTDPENHSNLKILTQETEKLRARLGAQHVSFSGILPGILYRRRIRTDIVEADVTIAVMLEVEKRLRSEKGLPEDAPIVILGGRGFIGRKLCKALKGRTVTSIDLGDELDPAIFTRPTLVFNVTRKNALLDYIGRLPESAILVNEVYPEPSRAEVESLESHQIEAFHIVGLRAISFPPFPGAYRGGIPCCAGNPRHEIDPILAPLTSVVRA